MKKLIMSLVLTISVSANAGLFDGLIDWEKVVTVLFQVSEKMNKNLEEIRLDHHAKYDDREKWEMLCDGTFVLKQNLEIIDLLLNKYNFATPHCMPLTQSLKLSSQILGRCMDYYDKEVQMNFDNNMADAMMMIAESQEVLNKCYPWLGNLLPGAE